MARYVTVLVPVGANSDDKNAPHLRFGVDNATSHGGYLCGDGSKGKQAEEENGVISPANSQKTKSYKRSKTTKTGDRKGKVWSDGRN